MSKRAGTFVTLREVVDEVGTDVVRFIMLTRKNDAPLDFDFAKVHRAVEGQPGLLRAIRPCARALGDAPRGGGAAGDRARPGRARQGAARSLDRLGRACADPADGRVAARRRERRRGARAAPHRLLPVRPGGRLPRPVEQGQGRGQPALSGSGRPGADRRRGSRWCAAWRSSIASGLGVFGVEPVEEMR